MDLSIQELSRRKDLCKPRTLKTTFSKKQHDDVKAIVHQAVLKAANYQEVARFLQIALARLDKTTDWNVVVGPDVFLNVRVHDKASCRLYVPCLLVDLLGRADSTDLSPADSRLGFAITIFKSANDVVQRKGRLEEEGFLSVGATVGAPAAAAGDQEQAARPAPIPEPKGGLKAPLGWKEDSSSTVSKAVSLHMQQIIGRLQATHGLNAASEKVFVTSLKEELTQTFGSTWHTVLANSPKLLTDLKPPAATGFNHAEVHRPGFAFTAAPGSYLLASLNSMKSPAGAAAAAASATPSAAASTAVVPAAPAAGTGARPAAPAAGTGATPAAGTAKETDAGYTPPRYFLAVYRTTEPMLEELAAKADGERGGGGGGEGKGNDGDRQMLLQVLLVFSVLCSHLVPPSLSCHPPFLLPFLLSPLPAESHHWTSNPWKVAKTLAYGVAAACLIVYILLSYSDSAATACARGAEHAYPVVPALLSAFPPQLATALGYQPIILTPEAASPSTTENDFTAAAREAAAGLRVGCSLRDSQLAELRLARGQGALYMTAACFVIISLLRMAQKTTDAGRMSAAVRVMRQEGAAAYAAKAGAAATAAAAAKGGDKKKRN